MSSPPATHAPCHAQPLPRTPPTATHAPYRHARPPPRHARPPPCGQTHTCKNITSCLQLGFIDGNDGNVAHELGQEWRQGKVMFSHESVILFTISLIATRSLLNLRHSLLWCGRYASYWNTFLFERMNTSNDLPFIRVVVGAHCCKKLPWHVNSLDILRWQIYMVKLWTRTPRSNYLHLHTVFGQIISWHPPSPPWGWCLPRKSWIRHCVVTNICSFKVCSHLTSFSPFYQY